MTEHHKRIEVNWVQAAAGALAAVTSAVLLSTVGVAGTLIGAALGSLAVTFGNAVYSYTIGATKDRVANAGTQAAARIGRAQTKVQAEEPARVGWRTVLGSLPWRRIVIAASALFLVAMLLIVGFELVTGRAVSSYTGGSDSSRRSTIPGLGRGGADPASVPATDEASAGTRTQEPGRSAEPTANASADPEGSVPQQREAPTQDQSSEPTPTTTATPTSTPTPTEATTPSPTAEPSP